MKYKGKIALWYYAVIIMSVAVFINSIFQDNALPILIVIVLIIALISSFAINNYIVLDKQKMVIHFGFMKSTIMLYDIISLQETNNPLSGKALSFDRIAINVSKGLGNVDMELISVKEKKEFIQDVLKYKPEIKYIKKH